MGLNDYDVAIRAQGQLHECTQSLTDGVIQLDVNDARLINSYRDSINEAIHRATVDARKHAVIPRKQFTPKPYWCPSLSDRKRFWWHLWVNNGRPPSGVVWECWKGVWFGLVYWGLTPQQQPGSYQGGEMMMMKNQFSGGGNRRSRRKPPTYGK